MSRAQQALHRVAQSWPHDPARPTLQFKELLDYVASSQTSAELSPKTVAAVRALKDNRLMHKYALKERTTKPASMPEHYDRLLLGYQNVLKGKRRTWWNILFGIYK
ncbi:hypothetical protein FRC03_010429 [Tulasnella sp. 419]|nr:hypothetical protein FRC02_007312 [Tulasnella sp. 418]KAG8970239.1 hypothetical protein FRC03_010429 [Tulasnella sp. 419]